MKRKDYVDAFEQIEEAIKEDGGDGDTSMDSEDSPNNENNVRIFINKLTQFQLIYLHYIII